MYYESVRERRDNEEMILVDRARNGETTIVAKGDLSATDIIGDENGASRWEINCSYSLFKLQILYNKIIFSIPDPVRTRRRIFQL